MSVVGFDVGNESCFIAVARRGGIDVIANEVSNRNTPAMVSFKDKARHVGEAAAGQYIVNSKNTISQFKRLIGRRFSEPDVQDELKYLPYTIRGGPKDEILIDVQYNGETTTFTPERVMSMLLKKLAETAEKANGGTKLADCVIGIPAYFTDAQRRAMYDATRIAGVNCLRLMNENCAVALAYGIYRTDLSETEPINVAFCDLGHSSFSVTIASFVKGKLTIRGVGFDRNVGGRNFDRLLFEHFADQVQKKYKLNVRSNPKACIRLLAACEKLKKVLSANASSKIAVESLMEDTDITFDYTRDEFEALVANYLEKLQPALEQALSSSGLTVDQLYSVEITGGSSRVPAVQQRIIKFFGKDLSKSLNFDEAIARGCALQAAILSPLFKVRDFEINDINQYPINFSWKWSGDHGKMELDDAASENVTSGSTIFPRSNAIPSSKMVTLKRVNQTGFEIHAFYENPQLLSQGASTELGRFYIDNIPVKENPTRVKVSVKLNIHGILTVPSAQLLEDYEEVEQPKETKPAAEGAAAETMDTSDAKPKTVKKTARTELTIKSVVAELSEADIQKHIESEAEIALQDRILMETAEKKNAVESYIYEMRDKLDGELSAFVTADVSFPPSSLFPIIFFFFFSGHP
eukprot:TRINITY_DN289_c1_g1_i2.p1 TRINITY_DN289_c1_g1~~TRINITY_DN289_c1_g1_i2.p1  ORF type:complete len:636 (-),score=148.09 TRINITY_DN289_c1_g1_i2:1470-3377(-)